MNTNTWSLAVKKCSKLLLNLCTHCMNVICAFYMNPYHYDKSHSSKYYLCLHNQMTSYLITYISCILMPQKAKKNKNVKLINLCKYLLNYLITLEKSSFDQCYQLKCRIKPLKSVRRFKDPNNVATAGKLGELLWIFPVQLGIGCGIRERLEIPLCMLHQWGWIIPDPLYGHVDIGGIARILSGIVIGSIFKGWSQ